MSSPASNVKLSISLSKYVYPTTEYCMTVIAMYPCSRQTHKTDGLCIKDLHLGDFTLRCFDCGGDVDFNETHNFFITPGALYLVCFNLSEYCLSTVERGSFLFGRLQLWLQYIYSKASTIVTVYFNTML